MYNQSHKYDLGTYNFFLHDLAQIFPRENALRFDKWQYCVHNSVFFSVYFSKIYHVTFLKVVPTLKKSYINPPKIMSCGMQLEDIVI